MTNEQHFAKFLTERPAICKSKLAKELEIDRVTIEKILVNLRGIPKARTGDFCRLMRKYGYEIG